MRNLYFSILLGKIPSIWHSSSRKQHYIRLLRIKIKRSSKKHMPLTEDNKFVRDPIKTRSSSFLLCKVGSEFGGSPAQINKIRRASCPLTL